MLSQGYTNINKIKRNNYLFSISQFDTSNPNNIIESNHIASGSIITINFSEADRKIILECLKLMKKITRLYYPKFKSIWAYCLEDDNNYKELRDNVNKDNITVFLSPDFQRFEYLYSTFKIIFKCLFNHYYNALKLPNGTYFYFGIAHPQSFNELDSSDRELSVDQFIRVSHFLPTISIPLTPDFFEEYLIRKLEDDSYQGKSNIIPLTCLFKGINEYYPKFLLYQKNIEKFIVPLNSKKSKNESLMYNLVNYLNTSNFIHQQL